MLNFCVTVEEIFCNHYLDFSSGSYKNNFFENAGVGIFFLLYESFVIFKQIIIFLGFLNVFHLYLVCSYQTTHEYYKKIWKESMNPYSKRNFVYNCWFSLFYYKKVQHFDKRRIFDLNFDDCDITPSRLRLPLATIEDTSMESNDLPKMIKKTEKNDSAINLTFEEVQKNNNGKNEF